LLQQIGGTGGDLIVYLSLGLIFGTVVLIVLGATALMSGRTSLRQRVGATARTGGQRSAGAGSIRMRDDVGSVGRLLAPVAKRLLPPDLADISRTRLTLVQAGHMRPSAVGIFYTSRILMAVALPVAALLLLPLLNLDPNEVLLFAALSGILGLYLPNAWIIQRTKSLQTQYRHAFPDALDLLVISVEAGLGLDAAIARVGQELAGAHRRLGEQFSLMAIEMRAGNTRRDALRNLSDRLGIDEVSSLVSLLMQSEELGTSIAEALRVYSDDMRARRMLAAEVKANALSVKLSIPLALFVFPVIMTVIMLPTVIRIFRTLGKL
jgi:tight adherence protein C